MCLQFSRYADDLPAGDETLCPPRLTIDAFTLPTSDTVFGDCAVDTPCVTGFEWLHPPAVTATYITVKLSLRAPSLFTSILE